MQPPLDGLLVLDFSHALAGPYCTLLMAAYGAEVIKVEGTETADMGRTWGPPFQGGEASYFLGLNSGKQSLAIDLKNPAGVELCRRLATQADVVVENFRPGSLDRLGLGWEDLRIRNRRLIYCSISGYGQNGPARDEPAMDLILQAACGLISVTGTPAGQLARCGHSVADITAGMFALIGILMALRSRERTGEGQLVDVSMLDGMISAMASNFANLFGSDLLPKPLGTAFATIVPYATFPTADRDIALAAANDRLWARLCEAIGHPALAIDERYSTNPRRVANRSTLEPLLGAILRTRPAAEWLAILRRHGVPCTLVRNLREVAEDPQAHQRQMFPVLSHPTAGAVRVTGLPVKLSASPGEIRSAAPVLGQHSREVLQRHTGLADSEIDSLRERGVIREWT